MSHRPSVFSLFALAAAAQTAGCARSTPKSSAHVSAIYDRAGHRLPDAEASSADVNWQVLTPEDPHYLDWNGVGSISPGCTATLLKKPEGGSGTPYFITAGHCYVSPWSAPTTVLIDKGTSQTAQMGKYIRGSGAPAPVRVHIDKIAYATMSGTDVSILQASDSSYADLIAQGLHPFALSPDAPVLDEAIVMPHEPLEGVSTPGMRLSECTVGLSANLREYPFHSEGAFRNHCSAVGGTSGAPVIAKRSGKIIGLLTTGTRDLTEGQPDCVDSRPCEVQKDNSGLTFPEENYAQHVFQFAACFDDHGDFDLDLPACHLTKP